MIHAIVAFSVAVTMGTGMKNKITHGKNREASKTKMIANIAKMYDLSRRERI